MTFLKKELRYYYWFVQSFIKKNALLLVISFVVSFFAIILFINSFPLINSLLFRKSNIVGLVGRYNLQKLPHSITSTLSNPLISINEKGELTPILVSSWEISDQNKTYVFHLKPNLYWSDGDRFTAHDIDLKFEGIKTTVIDDSTIEFKLSQPLSIFPIYLTKPLLKYPLKGVAGLYQVQSFKLNRNNTVQSIHLTPNKPDFPYKTYKFFDTEDDMILNYKKGQITSFQTSKKSVVDLFSTWKNTSFTKDIDYTQILTLFFNMNSEPLKVREIRKSFAYATPQFDALGVPAAGPIPPVSWAYSDKVKTYPHDLEKAREQFKKNVEASQSAELSLTTFYDYIDIAEDLKSNFEKIGAKINVRVLSYVPQDYDLLLTLWNPPTDPDQYYFWHSTQKEENITNYKNVKIDKLLEDGRKQVNVAERIAIYREFQQVLTDDLPAFFIYHPYIYTIERK